MLKKRIIFSLLMNKGVLFRTRNFTPNNIYTHNFIDTWSVDEIVMLDISREDETRQEFENFLTILQKISRNCFVPISAGGRIRSIEDAEQYLKNGADKIVVNTEAFHNPSFIAKLSEKYGSQCVVVSIDVKYLDGKYIVFTADGKKNTGVTIQEWIVNAEKYGAGEIFLNSIDRDGTLEGYDIELIKTVSSLINIPIIACGGAGSWQHFVDALHAGSDAVCTTNIFHFTEASIQSAKKYLINNHVDVRMHIK